MGCASSQGSQTAKAEEMIYRSKFKFEQRPYKGVETEGTKEAMAMFREYDSNLKPEDHILTLENVEGHRQGLEGYIESEIEKNQEGIDMLLTMCSKEEVTVTMRDGAECKMLVYRPNTLEDQKAPCYFYAHGGGAWSMRAIHLEPNMLGTCLNLNCVVFNIDYRLAPEHRCPVGQEDFLDCMNYALANPDKFGIDPKKAAMAGCSGGGWIIVGAANLLAKANNLSKIKAIFIHTGMLSNSTDNLTKAQLKPYDTDYMGEPAWNTSMYQNLLAKPEDKWENIQKDDQLFPGRASLEILKKYPPCVIWTSEFDFLRRDNEAFAEQLKKVNKLAEMSNMPGCTHGYHQVGDPETVQEVAWFNEEEKMAFDHLVAN